MDYAQTPLLELLRNIPADARLIYTHSPTHSQSIPVGRLAADAAAEIEKLRVVLETIAGFAPGNGDVCEIIAKRARDALRT